MREIYKFLQVNADKQLLPSGECVGIAYLLSSRQTSQPVKLVDAEAAAIRPVVSKIKGAVGRGDQIGQGRPGISFSPLFSLLFSESIKTLFQPYFIGVFEEWSG